MDVTSGSPRLLRGSGDRTGARKQNRRSGRLARASAVSQNAPRGRAAQVSPHAGSQRRVLAARRYLGTGHAARRRRVLVRHRPLVAHPYPSFDRARQMPTPESGRRRRTTQPAVDDARSEYGLADRAPDAVCRSAEERGERRDEDRIELVGILEHREVAHTREDDRLDAVPPEGLDVGRRHVGVDGDDGR